MENSWQKLPTRTPLLVVKGGSQSLSLSLSLSFIVFVLVFVFSFVIVFFSSP